MNPIPGGNGITHPFENVFVYKGTGGRRGLSNFSKALEHGAFLIWHILSPSEVLYLINWPPLFYYGAFDTKSSSESQDFSIQ